MWICPSCKDTHLSNEAEHLIGDAVYCKHCVEELLTLDKSIWESEEEYQKACQRVFIRQWLRKAVEKEEDEG